MKKILLGSFNLIGIFSCSHERTRFECDKYPFVVNKIEKWESNDGLCLYSSSNYNAFLSEGLFASPGEFIAKKDLFKIGDTVKFNK